MKTVISAPTIYWAIFNRCYTDLLIYLFALIDGCCCLSAGRSQTAVCAFNGELVAVGGCDAWNCTNTVEKYDPVADRWMFLPSMSVARRGAGVACFKSMS